MKRELLPMLSCILVLWATAGCTKQQTESEHLETRGCVFLDGTAPVSGHAVLFRRDPWQGGLTGLGQLHVLDTVPLEHGSFHWPKGWFVDELNLSVQHIHGTFVHRNNVSVWEGIGSSMLLPTPFKLKMQLDRPLSFQGKLHLREAVTHEPPTLADWVSSQNTGHWLCVEPMTLPPPLEFELLFPIYSDTLLFRIHWFEQSIENGIVPRSAQHVSIPADALGHELLYTIEL